MKLEATLATIVLLTAWTASTTSTVFAESTLTVDLSNVVRPATHVGSGSLYGVTEKLPADVMTLIAPLHPNMFTNPAANVQQPQGDAIVVAGRVKSLGATVTIRLADWFPGWYSFTNMNDWLDKMGQTVSRKKAANLTNIYAYEIWNEPNGTWKSDKPMAFNEFWRQSFVKLRELEPDIKITGPSLAGYNASFMQDFLSFCKTNKCLPDIVGWHDSESISNNVQSYRALEKKLGIGPLPITMNEYSGSGQLKDEGRPGSAAPLIAQLERSGVETACITYWDVPHPGRLGSLLANDTQTNGGWFFYKWYGEMTGNMVATSSSLPVNGKNMDGVASLDSGAGNAFVILGGINDGSIRIVVKGFKAAAFGGMKVHAVVEHTPFASRTTVVSKTDTLSTADVTVQSDQITVSISNANANDGYRLSLSSGDRAPAGAGGVGAQTAGGGLDGSAMAGDAGSSGGRAGASGSSGAGNSAAVGGSAGAGGTDTRSGAAAASGGAANAGRTGTQVGAQTSSNPSVPSGAGAGAAPSASKSSGCSCRAAGSRSSSRGRDSFALLSLIAAAWVSRRIARSRVTRCRSSASLPSASNSLLAKGNHEGFVPH
jgi:hypothetical protein